MTDFGDRMMDFLFEQEVTEETPITADLYRAALAAFPDEHDDVYGYFQTWLWMDWCDANLPQVEPEPEEVDRFVEAGLMRFYELDAKQRGCLAEPGSC
jgi:hypothetical protein